MMPKIPYYEAINIALLANEHFQAIQPEKHLTQKTKLKNSLIRKNLHLSYSL